MLDLDGTLIDSNDQHARAWFDTFVEAGYPVQYVNVRRLIGKGGDKMLPEILGIGAESRQVKVLTKRRGEIFEQHFLSQVRAFPFARAGPVADAWRHPIRH